MRLPSRLSLTLAFGKARPYALVLATILVTGGCRFSSGPGWERVVGVVASGASASEVFEAPASAYAGDAVTVTVRTVGPSDCTRAAGAEVIYRGAVVEITPYDWAPAAGTTCARDRRAFPREVRLRFDSMGTYTVRVSGRAETGELAPVLAEAQITITGRD